LDENCAGRFNFFGTIIAKAPDTGSLKQNGVPELAKLKDGSLS
jgi:hypothetical protein